MMPKTKRWSLAKNYTAPEPVEEIRLPGKTGKYALEMAVNDLHLSGKATDYDVVVSNAVANVLTGGPDADWTQPVHEDKIYALEREEFMRLIKNEGSQKRVEHMLETGKPLRN